MKLAYRPEIDGLRAIAVFSVIFYHAEFTMYGQKIFKGGFLGVDIFFVISGYLISSILLKEFVKNKKISLSNFYKRRIRRILPALIVVTFFSCLLSIFILLPESLIGFSKTVIYSLSFLSNMYFWHAQTVYGAENSFLSPLLHTWSLSVEEQFYIFYPLLLIILTNFIKKNFLIIIILIFFLSFFLSIIGNYLVPSFNFFVLPTRVWEFLSGGIIAYIEIFKKRKKKKSNFQIVLGLSLIFISIFYFNDELKHPSLITLVPVLGSCFIIYNFDGKTNFLRRFLCNKFMLFIGLISYSLYLWHFPLFSFLKHLGLYDFLIFKILILILILFLSILTYKYIEQLFRNKKFLFNKVLIFLFFSLFLLMIFSLKVLENDGYKHRLNKDLSEFQINFLNQKKDISVNLSNKNNSNIFNPSLPNILIMGNSHGLDLFSSLSTNKNFNRKFNFNFLHAQIKCMEKSIKQKKKLCVRTLQFNQKEKFKQNLDNYYKSDIILIKTRWTDEDVKSLDNLLRFLKQDNKKVIIFSSNPEFNFKKNTINDLKSKNILKKILYKNSDYLDRFIISEDRLPNKQEKIILNNNYFLSLKKDILIRDEKIKQISLKNNLKYFDFKEFFCNFEDQLCSDLTKSNRKIYIDKSGHLSADASREISSKIFDKGIIE